VEFQRLAQYGQIILLTPFAASLNLVVRVKIAGLHVALCRHNSGTISSRELFKCSKGLASLVVCNEKIFWVLAFGFFVSDIISGGLLGHLGPLHLTLGLNH